MSHNDEYADRVIELTGVGGGAYWTLDWQKIENSLGHALPSDYKRLCEELPPGLFNEFLFLLHPIGSEGESLLGRDARLIETVEGFIENEEECPGRRGHIFPCLITDNGDVGYWIADSEDPDEWTVAINESRGPDWQSTGLSLSAFLYQFLTGEYEVGMFPESVQNGEPVFSSSFDY
ncbi:hypothetical protein [Streptomyces sp. PSKA30]|uniref:hypothetical protein n=1 Tax=Streptomyces sp. PSKA30 TaxID=2874597 RepID=UPI001CD0B080|nr:hypothetical protein [Streptomyces sp. PSKA30]MBZ9644042.1 hypothetical protein [Streptomyces sp. PSKA30]